MPNFLLLLAYHFFCRISMENGKVFKIFSFKRIFVQNYQKAGHFFGSHVFVQNHQKMHEKFMWPFRQVLVAFPAFSDTI